MKKKLWLALTVITAILITLLWLRDTPGNCYAKGFAIGGSVCHQIPSHSFNNGDIQFPICARCTGLYLGSAFGLVYFFSQGKRKGLPKRRFLLTLLFLAITWAGDGMISFAGDFLNRPFLYETTNLVRLATGIGMGLVMSTALVTLFNVTIWQCGSPEPVLRHPWQVLLYFAISTLLAILLQVSGPIAFQLLAGVTILTVMVIITLLYTIFWVILTRNENKILKLVDLIPFFLAGFTTALAQVLLMNFLRGYILG